MDLPARWQDRIPLVRCPVCWAEPRQPCHAMRRDKAGNLEATSRRMTGYHWGRRLRATRLGAPKPRGRRQGVIPVIRLRRVDPPPKRRRKPRNPWGL